MGIRRVTPSKGMQRNLLRPNNATQYTAGDVIEDTAGGGVQTIFDAGRVAGGSGRIISCALAITANGVAVLAGDFELWLFDTAVEAHESDADTFTPTEDDMINIVGVLQFNTADVFEADLTAGAGGIVTYMAAQTFLPLGFQCTAASVNLHATLVVRNAYTPSAFEQYYLRMYVEQD